MSHEGGAVHMLNDILDESLGFGLVVIFLSVLFSLERIVLFGVLVGQVLLYPSGPLVALDVLSADLASRDAFLLWVDIVVIFKVMDPIDGFFGGAWAHENGGLEGCGFLFFGGVFGERFVHHWRH